MYNTPLVFLPRFVIARDAYRHLAPYCKAHGIGVRYVVIGGETAMSKGLPVLDSCLAGSGLMRLAALPFGGACTLAAMENMCMQIAALSPAPDFIIGMGGGKALDTAKGAASRLKLPLISMPTLVSNCAPITALSVVYNEEGTFDHFMFFDAPPELTLVDLDIAAAAPARYFRAGMGDTLAKHLESTFSARADELGKTLDHMSSIGLALSSTCYDPIVSFGRSALEEALQGQAGPAFELCARSIILSAGLVSLMADDSYNCALAHAVCYGLQLFEHVEREYLHGDLVAYGALVQLMMDGQRERAVQLRRFLVSIGTPVTLAQMNVPLDRSRLDAMLTEATCGPDMEHIPYPVTKEMVYDAMVRTESLE